MVATGSAEEHVTNAMAPSNFSINASGSWHGVFAKSRAGLADAGVATDSLHLQVV